MKSLSVFTPPGRTTNIVFSMDFLNSAELTKLFTPEFLNETWHRFFHDLTSIHPSTGQFRFETTEATGITAITLSRENPSSPARVARIISFFGTSERKNENGRDTFYFEFDWLDMGLTIDGMLRTFLKNPLDLDASDQVFELMQRLNDKDIAQYAEALDGAANHLRDAVTGDLIAADVTQALDTVHEVVDAVLQRLIADLGSEHFSPNVVGGRKKAKGMAP